MRAFALRIPKEGTNLFFDAVCIPKIKEDTEESRLKKLASEMYINFLNEPEIAAANIEYIQYSTPNDAALQLLDEEVRNNPISYPSDEVLENTQVYVNLSEETNLYLDRLWTEIHECKGKLATTTGVCLCFWYVHWTVGCVTVRRKTAAEDKVISLLPKLTE